ncbi:MAG: DUF488 domain-containing protein [Acidobacteria bacterium]|nr:DUF488 domain-containing protein [Acidobacteriota bacterium]
MPTLWTIGHSNVSFDVFRQRLSAHGITLVADVRRYPASRRHPQFNREALDSALAQARIAYAHVAALGGRRQSRADSRNTAWRNLSFRGYADYMETPAFQAALDDLVAGADERPTAVMCAEILWWQCHRSLIADALKARGHTVVHITAAGSEPHPYTSAARVVAGNLRYAENAIRSFLDD